MSAVAAPYGLRPVNLQGGRYNHGGAGRVFNMTVNVATAFYVGAVVVLGTNGEVTIPVATPTTAVTTPVIGVITGIEYVDPVLKYTLFDGFLPANAVTGGYTGIKIYVNDDPDQLYAIQAAGSVTAAQIGLNASILNPQAGSSVTKRSSTALAQATLASAATVATVRVVDFVRSDTSRPGDAFTDCIVRFTPTVHAYERAVGTA